MIYHGQTQGSAPTVCADIRGEKINRRGGSLCPPVLMGLCSDPSLSGKSSHAF